MSAWLDVAKFAPGYLSLAWLAAGATRKAIVRRHHIKIGPVEEVRGTLQAVRTVFMDFGAGDVARTGLDLPGSRDLAIRLNDLSDRVADKQLRDALEETARTLMGVTEYRVPISNQVERPGEPVSDERRRELEQDQAERDRRAAQTAEIAGSGVILTSEALRRLNELERRTVGR